MSKTLLFIAFLIWVSLGFIVQAQSGYPQYGDLYVNDFAGVMDAQAVAQVRGIFADLKAQTGVEAVVVTIQSVRDYGTGDETNESFATNLFNKWGVGSAARNDGVMILAAIRDREIQIAVGSGYDAGINDEMRSVLDENILPYFRSGDYSGGLFNGARAVVHTLTGTWPEIVAAPESPPAASGSADFGGGAAYSPPASPNIPTPVLVGGGALGLGGAALLFRRWTRYRQRACPNCGDRMTRLDEASDDVYLESGQKMEEMLQSIDYDVWKCPTCGATSVYPYPRLFSRYSECPQCHHKTLATGETVLSAPTYSSAGSKEIRVDCQNCKYHTDYVVALPRLVRSTSSSYRSSSSGSSSHSSFGGGRSSGGGASGKW